MNVQIDSLQLIDSHRLDFVTLRWTEQSYAGNRARGSRFVFCFVSVRSYH